MAQSTNQRVMIVDPTSLAAGEGLAGPGASEGACRDAPRLARVDTRDG